MIFLRRITQALFIFSIFLHGSAYSEADAKKNEQLKPPKANRPNVILILTDDQGWGDLAFNGNDHIDTPNLDHLFEKGVSFDRFYVSPVCSPTRASLLTGRHSLATGVYSVTRGGEKMRKEEVTLAEVLKKEGYVTSLYGKWHNGSQYPYDPNGQGFDDFLGFVDGHATRYFDSLLQRNGKKVSYKGYLPDKLTDEAIKFITQHHKSPFFTYLSFNTPHSPFELPKQYFDKYKSKGMSDLDASIYGMVENIDDNVGRILHSLERLKIKKNTIVLFLSDNGPAFPHGHHRYNGHMKGWKGKVDEGGVKVPFVIHWPEKISGGNKIKQIAQHIDVLPTLARLIGIDLGNLPIHGKDLTPLLNGNAKHWPDRKIFIHHFRNTQRPDQIAIARGPGSVRSQRWLATLNHTHQWQLFDLLNDPQQNKEVSKRYPKQLDELSQKYNEWYENLIGDKTFTPLPIEIGYKERPNTMLPAHEAIITDDSGIDYQHGSGWAHDWITTKSQKTGKATWPIKVVSEGIYSFTIGYAAPDGDHKSGFDIELFDQSETVNELSQFVPIKDDGERLYYTGEAPDSTWKEINVGEFQLSPGQSTLSLSFRQDDDGNNLLLKYVTIEYLNKK